MIIAIITNLFIIPNYLTIAVKKSIIAEQSIIIILINLILIIIATKFNSTITSYIITMQSYFGFIR